jgi:hypothetical protein
MRSTSFWENNFHPDDFYRHIALEAGVAGLIKYRHPAFAELFQNMAAPDMLADEIRHRSPGKRLQTSS